MKKRKIIKIVLLVLEILVVLILGLVSTVLLAPEGVRNNLISCVGKCAGQITGLEGQFDDKFTDEIDEEKIDVNEGINKEQFEDYITIALFGIDSRHNSLGVHR